MAAPVLPHHRGAGRPHARPGGGPAGRGAHRDGRAAGDPRAGGGGRAGGPGEERLRQHREASTASRSTSTPTCPWCWPTGGRVVQVLVNLLSNAARHSPASSAIRVGGVLDGVHVAISVTDEGRGIPSREPAAAVPQILRSPVRRAGRTTRVWAWPSARGSWRRTAAASGPRATSPAWARASPSPSPWPRGPPTPPRPRPARHREMEAQSEGSGAGAGGGR